MKHIFSIFIILVVCVGLCRGQCEIVFGGSVTQGDVIGSLGSAAKALSDQLLGGYELFRQQIAVEPFQVGDQMCTVRITTMYDLVAALFFFRYSLLNYFFVLFFFPSKASMMVHLHKSLQTMRHC
jgi:hypothetical protein